MTAIVADADETQIRQLPAIAFADLCGADGEVVSDLLKETADHLPLRLQRGGLGEVERDAQHADVHSLINDGEGAGSA